MDSTAVSGAAGSGSIPDGCTKITLISITIYVFIIITFKEIS